MVADYRGMNGPNVRLLSALKNAVVPHGSRPYKILGGINRGATMSLDLRHDSQRLVGLYEQEICGFIQRFASGSHTAVDIGAANGYYTLYFLLKSPARKVLAFEPDDSERARLRSNIELNPKVDGKMLEIYPEFLGRENDGANIRTLDSIVGSIVTPCIIKMDVDGPEVAILSGAPDVIAMPDVHWVIETHSKDLEKGCIAILTKAGYRATVIPNA